MATNTRRSRALLSAVGLAASLVVACTPGQTTRNETSIAPAPERTRLAVRMSGRFPPEFTNGLNGVYEPDDDGLVISDDDLCGPKAINRPVNSRQDADIKRIDKPHYVLRFDDKNRDVDPTVAWMLDRVTTHLCSLDRKATVLGTAQGNVVVVGDELSVQPLGPSVYQQQNPVGTLLQGPIVMSLHQPAGKHPMTGVEFLASDGGEHNVGDAPYDMSAHGVVTNVFAVIEYNSVRALFCECDLPQRHDSLPPGALPAKFQIRYHWGSTATAEAITTLQQAVDGVLSGRAQARDTFATIFP